MTLSSETRGAEVRASPSSGVYHTANGITPRTGFVPSGNRIAGQPGYVDAISAALHTCAGLPPSSSALTCRRHRTGYANLPDSQTSAPEMEAFILYSANSSPAAK